MSKAKTAGTAPLVLIGAGGHARVTLELVRACGRFDVIGLLSDDGGTASHLGVPVLGGDEQLSVLRGQGVSHAFVALGDNRARERLARLLDQAGFEQPVLVHPSALVSPSAALGPGALVMARAILGTHSELARGAVLNSGAIADHENRLAAFCHIAPGASLAGAVHIGERSLLGVGSSVRPGIRVGSDVIVGAGAAVVTSLPDGVTAVGVPARIIGSVQTGRG